MSSVGILIWLMLKIIFCGLLLILFIAIIKKKSLGKKILPYVVAFLVLATFGLYVYFGIVTRRNDAARAFIKEYKLNRLDGKVCTNCKVRVNEKHHYDIIENDQIIGNGNWHMEYENDAGFYFLRLENGPNYVIGQRDSIIEYIDRTTN